ncbi:MAG: glycosyltransferase family 2 protein [Nitrospira sp.]|nr:glycosyltransferase family 2 protein [Nitrospira sp.]
MTPPSSSWASVIIPIKDERDNLVPLVASLVKVMDSHESSQVRPYEILLVDDGSKDGSSEELDRLAVRYPQVTVFHLDRNYGQTCALHAGFRQSSGDIIIIQIDGDLQQDSEDILKLLPLTSTYDLVCGWRQQRQDGLVKKLSSWIANYVRNIFLHDDMHDTGCPLKVFRRLVLEHIYLYGLYDGMHRFFPALAVMHGFTVTEVPVRHYPRIHGHSKYDVGNRLFKSLYDLIAIRWMKSRMLQYKFKGM